MFGSYEDERIVLEPWQVHDLRDYSRIRFREKAPQIGYSMLRAMEAVWEAILFHDVTVGFISVDQREASEKILYAVKLYEGLPDMFKEICPRVGTNTEEIKLGDADRPSRIASYPATAGMRGRRMSVVLDEALSLDTPLPTPTGWTTMGDVKVGDRLIGGDGLPVNVSEVTPVMDDRICWRVSFADGSSVIASENHVWLARRATGRMVPQRRTTGELARHGGRFRVPRTPMVKTPDVPLPIDPYVLGLWLGDGNARNATIAMGPTDEPELRERIEACGYTVGRHAHGSVYVSVPGSHRNRFSPIKGLLVTLREQGLLDDKHIPAVYLRAGTDQRIALLQGLMDADGHITPDGFCTFVQGRERLTDDTAELLRSLGQTVHVGWWDDDRSRYGGMFRVTFTPVDLQPFRLERKTARVRPTREGSRWRTITSIEPAPTVPVRCVRVDDPDHLFLAGSGWTVTGNCDFYKDGAKEALRAGIGRVMRSPAMRLSAGSTCFGQDTQLSRMMEGRDDDGSEAEEIIWSRGRYPHIVATREDARTSITMAQKILDPADFDEEYNCIRANSSSDPFPATLVRGSTHEEPAFEIDDQGRVLPDDDTMSFSIGYDVGHTNNPSFMSIAVHERGRWIERSLTMPSDRANGRGLNLNDQHRYLVELMSRLPKAKIAIDARGIGAQMAEDIEKRFGRRVLIIMAGSTGQARDSMILDFKYSLEKFEFTLLPDRLAAREMQRTRRMDGKFIQPGSKRGGHYDRFWARAYNVQAIRAGARNYTPYLGRDLTVVGGIEVGFN